MKSLPAALVTYGWCRVSYVIVHSLAQRGVKVHVGDTSKLAMCRYSRYHETFSRYRNPYRDPEGFIEDLIAALKKTGARVLIPGHEDILTIARFRDRFPKDILIPIGDADVLASTINKWETVKLARAAGVSVPDTFVPQSREELQARATHLSYPIVVKTQIGNSAKGVFIVSSPQECEAKFHWLIETYRLQSNRWPMVQAFAHGNGYGVCLLYHQGEYRAGFCERYLRCKDGQFGTSVFRESVAVPHLIAEARKLMDSLQWHGVVHLDFHYEETSGQSSLIEINPRFWGALDLAVRAGVDFPWLLYRMAIDGDVKPVESYRLGVKSRWLVGELMHLFNLGKRGRLLPAMKAIGAMLGTRADGFDDFRLSDPAPLLAEALYYGKGFLASGSTNPIEEGMIG